MTTIYTPSDKETTAARAVYHTRRGLTKTEAAAAALDNRRDEAGDDAWNTAAATPTAAWARRACADFGVEISAVRDSGDEAIVPQPYGRALRIERAGRHVRVTLCDGRLPIAGCVAVITADGKARAEQVWGLYTPRPLPRKGDGGVGVRRKSTNWTFRR